MKYSAILFDLDGTLLPMDNDYFVRYYFKYLARAADGWGYHDSERLTDSVWKGVAAMVKNDGSRSNCDAFWATFSELVGHDATGDIPKFNDFYATDFNLAKAATSPTPLAREAVRIARGKAGYVILATNPIFPRVADESRLSWLDMSCGDFDLVTDYENCSFSKPNPEYYRQTLGFFGLSPDECLMIGNDVDEDILAAQSVGLSCYLLRDHMINRSSRTFDCPGGSFAELVEFLGAL